MKVYTKNLYLFFCFFIAIATSNITSGIAQDQAALKGTIKSTSVEFVPNVRVQLKGTSIGILTNADGTYLLPNIAPGAYTLVVGNAGFAVQERAIRLQSGETQVLRCPLFFGQVA
jgi:iron complex outermembrane receptor protein